MMEMDENRSEHIIGIVNQCFSCIDKRLIDHGARVAFIADAIATASGTFQDERDKLLMLSFLHDVGAYKTEEINQMVSFETGDVIAHAAYGYAFLHNTTLFGESSEAILYHHLHYDRSQEIDSAYKRMAALIFLADRVDILIATQSINHWNNILHLSGSVFDPELVESFLVAERQYGISSAIADGSFGQIIEKKLHAVRFDKDEVEAFLKMLVFSIDFRSPFTVTHTANTACISLEIAKLMGLDQHTLKAIRFGAFLHDIGKISVPYAILEKPGKLETDEMKLMQNHVLSSERILKGFVPDEVLQIAIRHHEKIDGTGYPYGLSGAELTPPQRIVAVADIVSALINRRSYKEPFSKEDTLKIIKSMMTDGRLCPQVCGVVLNQFDLIMDRVHYMDDPVVSLYEKVRSEYASSSLALQRLESNSALN